MSLERGAERADTRARLLGLRGVGPWTASYVTMRALGDPDVFLDTDAAARRVLASLGPGRLGAACAEQSRMAAVALLRAHAPVDDSRSGRRS